VILILIYFINPLRQNSLKSDFTLPISGGRGEEVVQRRDCEARRNEMGCQGQGARGGAGTEGGYWGLEGMPVIN